MADEADLFGCLHGHCAIASGRAALAQGTFDLDAPPVGKAANTLMIRVRALGVIPLDTSSSISVVGGQVNATAQAAPEVSRHIFSPATSHSS